MAAPPKTSDAAIIKSARTLLERHGRSGFSMNDVASRVGVRAPSLYSRFADRAALLEALEVKLWGELRSRLEGEIVVGKPFESLRAQARAYRAFAKANPNGYSLLFDFAPSASREAQRARASAGEPIVAAMGDGIGAQDAQRAVRVLAPFLHGFVAMELAGAIRGGPGLGSAFEQGVDAILEDLRRAMRTGKKAGRGTPSRKRKGAKA